MPNEKLAGRVSMLTRNTSKVSDGLQALGQLDTQTICNKCIPMPMEVEESHLGGPALEGIRAGGGLGLQQLSTSKVCTDAYVCWRIAPRWTSRGRHPSHRRSGRGRLWSQRRCPEVKMHLRRCLPYRCHPPWSASAPNHGTVQ